MRRIARIALPLVSLLMLAAAAVLIAQNLRALPFRKESGPAPAQAATSPAGTTATDQAVRASSLEARTMPAAAAPVDGSEGAAVAPPASASGTSGSAAANDPTVAVQNGTPSPTRLDVARVVTATGIASPPEPSHPYFLEEAAAPGGIKYGITRNRGVFVSTDGGATWQERSNGLPLRVIYPFTDDPIATMTSLGVDPADGKRVAVTTSSGIFVSDDEGATWKAIPIHDPIRSSAYFSAIALSPFDRSTIAVGTSFSGIFTTPDGGKTWVDRSDSLGFIYQGAGFDEEVAGLAYSPTQPGVLYMGVGFGGSLYRSSPDEKSWTRIDFPGEKNDVIRSLSFRSVPKAAERFSAAANANGGGTVGSVRGGAGAAGADRGGAAISDSLGWIIDLATDREDWSFNPESAVWTAERLAPLPPAPSAAKQARMAAAANHTGIYLLPWEASAANLPRWIAFLKANGLNTIVVDVKDDSGRITYNTRLPLAWKIGAVHPFFNIGNLIRVAHENGIYVVGRLVVFKDPVLYRYDDYKYAIWDPQRNAPWGHFEKEEVDGKVKWVQKEFWVDPFSEFVWRYDVSVAEELQNLGINEIQFDYIRFPSEVTSSDAVFRARRPGQTRDDALESFLVMAREALHIPISVDLFGYNSWYPIAGWVGQNINMYSNYADVICPMFYPSLFPLDFLPQFSYMQRAKYLYRVGTWRARQIVEGRAIIRPFVQSYLMLRNELAWDEPQYSEFLRLELEGAQEAHSSGFTLWNHANHYYMVTFPLAPYTP